MMRRSFVRMVIGSVLACWVLGFVVLVAYARSQSWTEEMARSDGVFLVHELLARTPMTKRAERLRELQQHSSVSFSLIAMDELQRRLGRPVRPDERVLHQDHSREQWYFLVFEGRKQALAAGPVDPASPPGVLPIGVILVVVLLPVIAGAVAFRVERRLAKVERASEALAVGDFSARVDDQHGAPDELAARFNAMAERIEQLVRSRDELVQAVSHELGSPLSRLRFHMELLAHQPDEQRAQRLVAMTHEIDALDELVAELLSYVQSDDLQLDRRAFDPTRGLNDLVELARLDSPEEKAVEVELLHSSDATVFADQRLFQRAIENLLRNAVRHARGRVLLELTQDEEHVHAMVHDDGPGIAEEQREKVLTPFYRLGADRDRKTGGVGLGLAIVSRIVRRHDGRLTIGSSPLGGALVTTSWPRPS